MFLFLLFATAFATGFTQIATHPDKVKELIAGSGIYSTVVPSLVKQQGTIEVQGSKIPVTSPEVQSAVNKAVTPDVVKQNTEGAIDSLYHWLEGKTDEPTVNFNLADHKSSFADSLAASVQQRLASLPPCTNAQSLAIARSGTFDAVNASCMPRNMTPALAAQQVKNYLNSNQSFLDEAKITTADLKNEAGQSPFEQPVAKKIPQGYQWAKKSSWILPIITILTAAGIVMLSRTRKIGLRFIGINMVIVGAMMFIFTIVLDYVTQNTILPKIKIENAALQTAAGNLIDELAKQIINNYRFFGIIYILLGAAIVGTLFYLNKKNSPAPVVQPANKANKKV